MKKQDRHEKLRQKIQRDIYSKYPTMEKFCYENDLSKTTVSNFLNAKKDIRITTLDKIADALDKKITITLKDK